jgi:ABC-type phosphate/phosphonate transport system substrate-binding protein
MTNNPKFTQSAYSGRMRTWVACLVALTLWGLNLETAQSRELTSLREIAIFPYLSPQKLVQLYAPLSKALASHLGHPVRVVSAPNYPTFMKRLAQGEYNLVINASHMARMALAPTLVNRDLAQAQIFLEDIQKEQNRPYLILEDEQGRKIVSVDRQAQLPVIDYHPTIWLKDGIYD